MIGPSILSLGHDGASPWFTTNCWAVTFRLVEIGSVIGFGLVVNSDASWLSWQGFLLGPFGLGGKTGAWAFANLGVLVALVIGYLLGKVT